MSSLITSLENLDRELIKTIDVSVTPVLMLEDIESGSLSRFHHFSLKEPLGPR